MSAVRSVTRIQDQDDGPGAGSLTATGQVIVYNLPTAKFVAPAATEVALTSDGTTSQLRLKNKNTLTAIAGGLTLGEAGHPLTLAPNITGVNSSNKGFISVGNGPFDGVTAGFFSGNSQGTLIAVNQNTGGTRDYVNFQIGGVDRYKIDVNGYSTTKHFGENTPVIHLERSGIGVAWCKMTPSDNSLFMLTRSSSPSQGIALLGGSDHKGMKSNTFLDLSINSAAIENHTPGTIAVHMETSRVVIPQVIGASANYGSLSVGSAPFDGVTAGFFAGSTSGTSVAVNTPSAFGGNLLDLQVAGSRKLLSRAAGGLAVTTRTTAPVTGELVNNSFEAWVDTAASALKFVVKDNAGVLKSGSIALA